MEKDTVMDFLLIQMGIFTQVNGKMEKSMEQEPIYSLNKVAK
jgi:hypothetical protein